MNQKDVDKMYENGTKKFVGDENCPYNLQESIEFISKAAEQGHKNAKILLQIMKEEQFFAGRKASIPFDLEKVRESYISIRKNMKILSDRRNFIPTMGAIIRLTKLHYFNEIGIPILLEGPTATSKTFSLEILSYLEDKRLLRFNFNSETKVTDLLPKYVGDENSWSGLSTINGPFLDAYQNGCNLLLEDINLACDECLNFIGEAIDNGKINIKMQGIQNTEIIMHPDFRLIATQNPNKELNKDFITRFQIIDFPAFNKYELTEIAKGLAKSFNFNTTDQFIHDLIEFHMNWSSIDDAQCFTIREIAATIHALSNGDNCFDIIMAFYGARYKKQQKSKLKELFLSFESFKDMKPSEFEYPAHFPECFHNKNLEEALKAMHFRKSHGVILTGTEGSGITQLAKWVAQLQNEQLSKKGKDEIFCVCTEEAKWSDFVGSQKPSENRESGQELIIFKQGFLSSAFEQGKCVVFDSFDEVPSAIYERLNNLFDEKYDGKQKTIETLENLEGKPIIMDENFRMLCTCKIDKINQMPPAFINRFDVIVLENQLEDINDDKLKELIEILLKVKLVNNENKDQDSNETEIKPSSSLVDLIFNSFDRSSTMFKLSRLCKAVNKYIDLFSNISSKITQETIVKFATDLLMKTDDFFVPKEIENFFIDKLVQANDKDDFQYFFKDSPPLRSFISKLYAASIINLPIVIYGEEGVGKTSSAKTFGRLRRNQHNCNIPCLMLPFHVGTKRNDVYGTTTIKNEKFTFINGPLTKSLQKGFTFIADEMNLSTISTMKALAPALEPCIGEKIYIFDIGDTVTIHPDFFFIVCQHELGTIERNAIPPSIASRFRILYYPIQQEDDLSTICFDIVESLYPKSLGLSPSFSVDDARNIGKYMTRLNKLKQNIIPQWSLRDITKLFKRIHHQDEFCNNYEHLTFYHNVLFYTLAPVCKSEICGIFDMILNLIGDTFNLDSDRKNELKKCYYTETSIQNFEKGQYFMKGNTGISTNLFPNFKEHIEEFSCLPSLMECIFKILLSDSSEPILLVGPSCYKTFISKLYLANAKVIELTKETTVSQLIGSSIFLRKSEAKYFYLDLICKICQIYDNNIITKLKEKLSKNELMISDITTETKAYLQLHSSFDAVIHRLTEKLFDNSTKNNEQNILSDVVIEFKPGPFLLSILQDDSIVLKNISNLQILVFERFNELLTGKQNITLFEDINDTITKSDQKEISRINSSLRVFGTCSQNSAVKLSKDVLSHITVINTSEYTKNEQENVLKSYNVINSKNLSNEIIDMIIEFSISFQNHLKKSIPFTQLINIIEICSRLIQKASSIPQKNILGIVLYRVFFGLLEKRSKYKDVINTIFTEIDVPLPSQFLNPLKECPFLITNKDCFQGIESKITGLFIRSADAKEVDLNVAFTPSFVDMLDIIHFGISAKIPVILEGNSGQGKQKAIEYIAKNLGYDVINIVISKSTKIDDLFGNITIMHDNKNSIDIINPNFTKLANAIKSDSGVNNAIFVFHNLNNASPVVLEKLVSLFSHEQRDFSFPDGTIHPKSEINIIGIFNPKASILNPNELPASLIYSSIYHIVENPKKNDVLTIIKALFQPTDFRYETLSFHNKYKITKEFTSQNNALSAVTLYDINKYILFRTVTNEFFDENSISRMLFGYRFLQQETINQVLEDLELFNIDSHPTFTFNDDKNEIYIKLSNYSEGLTLKIHDEQNVKKIQNNLNSLTVEQQQCLFFLTCAILSKRTCIIQGSISSGKSHIIQLFAYMFGRKLNIFQMNSDSDMSILTGQSVAQNDLSEKDIKEIQSVFSDLQTFDELNTFIKKNFSIQQKDWTPKKFSELLSIINNYKQDKKRSNSEKILLEKAETRIIQKISPTKKFNHDKSTFIRAMENGEWVVFEDLDSAPQEIEEKLSSLFGDDPEIDLSVYGENYFFSRSKPNSKKIHDDFHLFITYDPSSKVGSRKIEPNLLNKCISFTLPSLDLPAKSLKKITKCYLNDLKNDYKFTFNFDKKNSDQIFISKKDETINNEKIDDISEIPCCFINIEMKKFNEEKEVFEIDQYDEYEEEESYEYIDCINQETVDVSINFKQFENMISYFTEKDRIERAINLMQKTDIEKPLEIKPYTSLSFKSEYINPDVDISVNEYPIISLIQQSYYISQVFISAASEQDLPYSTLCANILIDCSAFISDENRIFNLFIICALTNALTTLDIPYSAAVIGDRNFKCIIKPFKEPHSYKALQRICDCLHIKRYRAELPGCIDYAIKSMGYPNNTRENRAIFTFTDGLDENLVKTKGWSELFKNTQLSFGFVFIKSSILDDKNLKFFEKVWNKFEKETNGKKSVVNVAKIYADRNLAALNPLRELFVNVIKRTNKINEENLSIDKNYIKAIFEIPENIKLKSISILEEYMKMNYGFNKCLYVQRSDILKNAKYMINQLDSRQFYNKLKRIAKCNVDNSLKKEFLKFLGNCIESKKKTNKILCEKIFQPNKESKKIISSTGPYIDTTAFIFNLISPVPDHMIFLNDEGGFIPNYGITVVIDASYSCFNPISSGHSFQTIKSVLISLSEIDIQCFDLIIATNSNPIVLCSQLKTSYALSEKSTLWYGLFAVLQNIEPSLKHSDIASAIHTAFDLRRMRTIQYANSMMFVLTDGFYEAAERPRIIQCVNNCVQSGMITVGIGMGINPKGIEKLFPQYVFSANPSYVMKGVSDLFTNNNSDHSETMSCFYFSSDSERIMDAFNHINETAEMQLFKTLCNDLCSINPIIESFNDFIMQEEPTRIKVIKHNKVLHNGEEMYIKNFLKSNKILIVHLCDDTVCSDPKLNKKYIFENYIQGETKCINKAVKFFGITLQVVQNYEDAILEITKSNNGLCEYYAVWVICGGHPEQLPTNQRDSNKYIVEQFIDVLIKFWKNGGSLVFWADNDPYTFQVNLFLNKVRFENEEKCPSGKVDFQIHGFHQGGEILLGDDSGKLMKEQVFNKDSQIYDGRNKLYYNIIKLYEGNTISYVENIDVRSDSNYKEKILPFKPFAIDSEGGISILFYTANLKTGTGDIVIDCGFSKLFDELYLKGTFRYIQNLAGWTYRPEVHIRNDRMKPWEWRPKAVSHTITNITTPSYCSFTNHLILYATNIPIKSVLKSQNNQFDSNIENNIQKYGGNVNGVLRFSIQWNDIGSYDGNDLDAHCMQPNGVELYYSNKYDSSTTGKLDVDITHPEHGKPAIENITWTDKNKMCNGTYRFFVHQFAYRDGHSGFRAQIKFDGKIYSYDYRSTLPNKSTVDVASVTLQNGRFSISHSLPCK